MVTVLRIGRGRSLGLTSPELGGDLREPGVAERVEADQHYPEENEHGGNAGERHPYPGKSRIGLHRLSRDVTAPASTNAPSAPPSEAAHLVTKAKTANAVPSARTPVRHCPYSTVSPDSDTLMSRRRDAGWQRALEERGVDPADARVLRVAASEQAGYDAAHQLVVTTDRPDGIVVDSPQHAMAVLRAAADLNLRVPTDLGVVAMEFGRAAEYSIPRLTSVDSPLDQIAEAAVEAITAAPREERLFTLDGTDFTLTARESSALGG